MKEKTLKQVGYQISGKSTINLWGGGQGEITMQKGQILGSITKSKLLKCINDGGFGCESVESADIVIHDLYEKNYTEFNRSIIANKKQCAEGMRGI